MALAVAKPPTSPMARDRCGSRFARARAAMEWAWRQWQRLHATHSLAWSLLICVVTPLPSLVFIISLEAIPLKPPSAGWRANDTTWLRLWLFGIVITLCLLFQAREMVPKLPLNATQALIVAVTTSTGYTVVYVAVCALWRFPLPFGTVLGVIPFVICLALSLAAVVGLQRLREVNRLGRPMVVYAQMIVAQCSMAFVYPIYNAVFLMLGPTQKTFFFLLLPVIKLTIKNVVARISADMEDLVPEFALFTVELFNALYMATCMQNAGSFSTSLVIIALDAVTSFLALRRVDETTSVVAELHASHPNIQRCELLALVQQICHEGSATTSSNGSLSIVRLRTVERLQLNRTASGLIRSLEAAARVYELTEREKRHSATPRRLSLSLSFRKSLVQPINLNAEVSRTASMPTYPFVPAPRSRSQMAILLPASQTKPSPPQLPTQSLPQPISQAQTLDALTTQQKRALVEQTLRALFQCEYLVLTEYIECAMPMVYVVYTAVLTQLHNAQFYAHTRAVTPAKLRATLSMVMGYAALEALSLLILHALLQRKLRVSALHQLAFVLETQRALIQGKMLVWAPFILQFTLLHCGVDFTFRFKYE